MSGSRAVERCMVLVEYSAFAIKDSVGILEVILQSNVSKK
jgi:hypothetical protein